MEDKQIIIDAESKLLAIMINYNETIQPVSEVLKPEDFILTNHQNIYTAITKLNSAGESVSNITIGGWLNKNGLLEKSGGYIYLGQLLEYYLGESNCETLTKMVWEASKERKFDSIIRDYNQKRKTSNDLNGLIFNLQKQVSDFSLDFRSNTTTSAYEVAEIVEKEIKKMLENPKNIRGIPSGFPKLDDTIGLFEGGQLSFIAGRPNIGKSVVSNALFINFAIELKKRGRGESVILFSLEMKKENVITRALSNLSAVPIYKLKNGHPLTVGEWDRFKKAKDIIKTLPMLIEDRAAITLTDIRNKLVRLKREKNLKIAIIDYWQIMGSSDLGVKEEYAILSRTAEGLKNLARELDILIIAMAQLNRNVEQRQNKVATMADLKGSGSAEQAADSIITLYREDYNNPTEEQRPDIVELQLHVLKNRNGNIGNIKYDMFLPYSRIREK